MPYLSAQGPERQQHWRRPVPAEGESFVVGRESGDWSIPWDPYISRQHIQVCWEQDRLTVRLLPQAQNPIFKGGHETNYCQLALGEQFVIGQTRFQLGEHVAPIDHDSPSAINEQSFSADYLRGLRFYNAEQRIEVLSRLPELIANATADEELFTRLTMMLLAGVPRANLVALVAWERDDGGDRMRILHWERRLGLGGDFRPSRKLVGTAIEHGSSVVHVWNAERAGESTYTMSDNVDWAFCTPIVGEACAGWGVYVAGRSEADRSPGFAQSGNGDSTITSTGPIDLRGDLKFTELVASTVGALRGVQALQRRQATLSQFFAPAVFRAMGTDRSEAVLQPRETEVTVLFCDLRGFSRHSERSADKLLPLLERVSQALGVMTHQILDHGGVLGDFQGDAAMGFWGWPLAQPDKVPRACQAALTICNQFQSASQDAEHSLAGFRVGIGMATGRAVAGRIGTEDQVKVTVFGPVVNLASRLEGMTKRCRAAILIDGATAERVRREVSPDIARLRRVARVRPYGMDAVVDVHELLPPAEWPEALSDLALQRYGEALLQFEAGHLHEALSLLDGQLQADPVANFLAAAINELGSTLPTDFDGVIRLTSKE